MLHMFAPEKRKKIQDRLATAAVSVRRTPEQPLQQVDYVLNLGHSHRLHVPLSPFLLLLRLLCIPSYRSSCFNLGRYLCRESEDRGVFPTGCQYQSSDWL